MLQKTFGLYIIKIKGKVKIPDYVQVRDDNFTLLAYFRADRPEKGITQCGLGDKVSEVKSFIEQMPFSKLLKLEV